MLLYLFAYLAFENENKKKKNVLFLGFECVMNIYGIPFSNNQNCLPSQNIIMLLSVAHFFSSHYYEFAGSRSSLCLVQRCRLYTSVLQDYVNNVNDPLKHWRLALKLFSLRKLMIYANRKMSIDKHKKYNERPNERTNIQKNCNKNYPKKHVFKHMIHVKMVIVCVLVVVFIVCFFPQFIVVFFPSSPHKTSDIEMYVMKVNVYDNCAPSMCTHNICLVVRLSPHISHMIIFI